MSSASVLFPVHKRQVESRATAVERKALQLVSVTLLLIAVYIDVRAVAALTARSIPDSPG